jgi:hypothetical protein
MRRALLSGIWLLGLALPAAADIWECTEADGTKRFTNIRAEAKGCKLLSVSPPNTVPGLKPPAAKPAPDFPKVGAQTQKDRDAERRKILEQELANEQRLLEQARKELAEQEAIRLGSERNYQRVLDRLEPYRNKVRLHEDNVANIKRELANIK